MAKTYHLPEGPSLMNELIDTNDVEILKENSVYRIGDLFYRKGVRWEEDRETVLRETRYSGTIMSDYLRAMKHEDDFTTLDAVVRQHVVANSYAQPGPHELVVHLRLGDLIERGLPYEKKRRRRALLMYRSLAEQLSEAALPITSATIVTALHFGVNIEIDRYFHSEVAEQNSFALLRHVESEIRESALDVGLKSSANVDEDFAYMVMATHFLKGESGMSDLVGECRSQSREIYSVQTLGGGLRAKQARLDPTR